MIYKQIFIKSVDDLPKEEGEYFCNRSGLMSVQKLMPGLPKKSFQREIRWYLQPCEIEIPSNEEIACEIIAEFLANPHPNQRNNYNREKKAFARGAKWAIEEIIKRNK